MRWCIQAGVMAAARSEDRGEISITCVLHCCVARLACRLIFHGSMPTGCVGRDPEAHMKRKLLACSWPL